MVVAFLAVANAEPVTYALEPARSWLYVVAYYDRDRMTPITAHDHVVKAVNFDGRVVWDPSDPSACEISFSFPVTALVIDPPGAREREKLPPEGAIEEGSKVTVVKNMLTKGNLWGDVYPTISYRSTACVARSDGRYAVTGDLTIRGTAKRLTVPMVVKATEDGFAAGGVFELTHADFGMTPYTLGPFTPKNQERLKFVVDVVGEPLRSYVP